MKSFVSIIQSFPSPIYSYIMLLLSYNESSRNVCLFYIMPSMTKKKLMEGVIGQYNSIFSCNQFQSPVLLNKKGKSITSCDCGHRLKDAQGEFFSGSLNADDVKCSA